MIAVVEEVARELSSGRSLDVDLRSALAADLGIDSLARAELVSRLERHLGIAIQDGEVARAETVDDIVRLAERARPSRAEAATTASSADGSVRALLRPPAHLDTLVDLVRWHAERNGSRRHMLFYDEQGSASELTFSDLYDRGRRVSTALRQRGLRPGQTVAIMLPSGLEYFEVFTGILLAGGIPVPLYPPVRPSQVEDHLRRQVAILDCAEAWALVTNRQIAPVASLLRSRVPTLRHVPTVESLTASDVGAPAEARVEPHDVAFLQFTSGSTGQPKGVTLTHHNLLSNLRVMGRALDVGPEVMVSWLPLYHDMGLIGAWMGSLRFSFDLVLMSPLSFLARPARWLQVISEHQGTLSAAPNFAYQLCVEKVRDEELEGVDLSAWRLALNGAEAVSPTTIDAFADRFGDWGFRREAMLPVYGLAESSLGVAFPPPGRGPRFDRVRRRPFAQRGEAVAASDEESDVATFVSCGLPLAEHEIRIVDDSGRESPERREGRLQFRGASATSGYFRDPDATAKLFDGDWVESGDRAYVADGELFVTGRIKDVIIRAGRNLYPHEIEEAVGVIDGVRKGCVAVFAASPLPDAGTERLVVLAETRLREPTERDRLDREIRECVTGITDSVPDVVVLGAPGAVLKTSSGKIRRAACRDLFESGYAGQRRAPVWLQLTRVAGRGLLGVPIKLGRRLLELLWAIWAWTVTGGVAVVAVPLVVTTPGLGNRRSIAKWSCRALFGLAGVPIRVRGLENLPEQGPWIVVANHASFADALLLTAVLPPRLAYVAKRELDDHWISRTVLHRLGAQLVERFDAERGRRDAAEAAQRAARGDRLVFFPEGTFRRYAGVLPFKLGAFTVATDAGADVVPLAITGSRYLLRGVDFFPRRSPVEIVVDSPVRAASGSWSDRLALRDQVRERLVEITGEPDLGDEVVTLPDPADGGPTPSTEPP